MERLEKIMKNLENIGFTKLNTKPVMDYKDGKFIIRGNISINFCLGKKIANVFAEKHHIPAKNNRFEMAYFTVMINENKDIIVREKSLVLDSIFRKSFENMDYWDIKNKIEEIEESLGTIIYTSVASL